MKIECFCGCFEYTITIEILKLGSKLVLRIYIVLTAMMLRETEECTIPEPVWAFSFSLRRKLRHSRKA